MRAKPPTTCRTARIAAALLVMAAALLIVPSWARGASDDTKAVAADPEDAAYWLRNREGWFWYRDPPAAARRPAPPAPKPPRELADFEAMQWAVSTGLMNGMDGKLASQGSATRAQVATMLMRFAELG